MTCRILLFTRAPISEVPIPCFCTRAGLSREIETALFRTRKSANHTIVPRGFIAEYFCLQINLCFEFMDRSFSGIFLSMKLENLCDKICTTIRIRDRQSDPCILRKFYIPWIAFFISSCGLKKSSSEIPLTESAISSFCGKIHLTRISLARKKLIQTALNNYPSI